ncbi:HAMP domain-containing protein [candidate division KSB1 bacterium]|nr:HAMP domain-containing protein [candidate division KSB1 bacterium]
MEVFLTWVGIVALFIAWYLIYIWRKSARGFRLEFKLTLIFILLVLLPGIPLLFVVSGLLTQGVEMFLLPGVEQALSQSLHTVKLQMEEPGHHFLLMHPTLEKVSPQILAEARVDYVREIKEHCGSAQQTIFVQRSHSTAPDYKSGEIATIFDTTPQSRIVNIDSTYYCEVFQFLPDSVLHVVGYAVDNRIIHSKNLTTESLRIYNSLSLLKRSVIEGQLIWALASIIVIILAVVAIQAARILSNGISRPIRELAEGMQRVAAGDLSSRVDVRARDEIRILVNSFNQMADDLRTSQEQLVRAERLAAWRDVARRISHEIKNILTPIQISLHRLRRQFPDSNGEKVGESLSAIDDEMQSLQRMADEFTQFARMPQMHRELNNVNAIISAIIPLIEGGTKPIKVVQNLEQGLPTLNIDRDQFKRALHNLMKNGVEASPVGGTISVRSFRHNNNGVCIEIQDTGSGMDSETLNHIFDPYFTTKKRGMGLGLSIVKRIIEEHDGKISFESEEMKGTTVKILLKNISET